MSPGTSHSQKKSISVRSYDSGTLARYFTLFVLVFAAGAALAVFEAGALRGAHAQPPYPPGCVEQSSGPCYTPGDYDGDRKADLALFRPESATWYVLRSSDNETSGTQWGLSDDKLVPADYDGDRKDDYAVFRASVGIWYIVYSSDGSGHYKEFGGTNAIPAPGDYDGDGKADFARVKGGVYEILQSSDGSFVTITLPTSDADGNTDSNHNDIIVPGDYDGDGTTDAAIFDEQEPQSEQHGGPRVWVISRSSAGLISIPLGGGHDVPVPGDYNGDGKTDIAVWHSNGDWSIIENLDDAFAAHSVRTVHFGEQGDLPTPGDYDGDGKTDHAVWRADTQTWHILSNQSLAPTICPWGLRGDIPIAMALKIAEN